MRTEPGKGQHIKEFFDTVLFQYELQDILGEKVKQGLIAESLEFEEVIISLDAPAQKAKKTRSKSSLMGRLFGSE